MEFKDRLKTAMELRQISGKKLSQKTGISRSSICLYLSGERTPKTKVFVQLANALNVSPYYLLGMADNMSIEPITVNNMSIIQALGGELSKEQTMRNALMDDIKAILSRQDLETLRTMYNIIKTLAK